MTPYPNLLSPLRIGTTTLPNRMVMGAMHTRLETMDRPIERLAAFYATRARGEIAMILTGGYAPVPEGVMDEGGLVLNSREQLAEHMPITSAVRKAGGRIVLQILHAGRYARVPECVAPSPAKARINAFAPRALATDEIRATIESYANTAALAAEAGYAGVEIMGSEGSSYELIDDRGLHYTANGERHLLEVDNVIVCAGQESERSLHDGLARRGIPVQLIGGADEAAELDAYRAIDQATRLAVSL